MRGRARRRSRARSTTGRWSLPAASSGTTSPSSSSSMGESSLGLPHELGPEEWEKFAGDAALLGVSLSPAQVRACERYLQLLCEWNQRFNLTAIEGPDEILQKHFLDSLTCALVLDLARQQT